jgi:protein kinase N
MALSDEYDSAAATSWKDTATDLDSLVQSTLSLAQSDSFEYADVADRLRIREKERTWASKVGDGDDSKTWKSPHVERKHLLQQQKFKEFLEKRLGKTPFPLWKAEMTEDSDDDDETGDAWSFCGLQTDPSPQSAGKALKREDTVKRIPSGRGKDEMRLVTSAKGAVAAEASHLLKPTAHDPGSLSDSGPHRFTCRTSIGPFGCRTPTPPPSKVTTSVTSPFTNIPGKRTDQLSKAEKFGTIIGAFRKPGHHVGPSKNPDCVCEHCRKYYEDSGYRTRTRSVGDMPLESMSCSWKNIQSRNCQGNTGVTGRDSDVENSSIAEDASVDNEKSVNNTSVV